MSNYRRFITYLFQYENGEKMEQCGYARVEQKQNLGKIEFHIKNCGMDGGEILPYFFANSGQVRIPIGRLIVKNQLAEGSFRFDCSRMGDTQYDFEQMRGLVIPLEGQRLIVSQWDDEEYQWEQLLGGMEQLTENKTVQEAAVSVEQQQIQVEQQQIQVEHETMQEAAQIQEPVQEFAQEQKSADQPLSSQEIAAPLSKLQTLRGKIYPFEGDLSVWAIQAQLRDIKHLPKEYWHLGNNSFVLRGYFNFGSILIGYNEQTKRYFLGVPGVFHRQEKVIAGLFGFDHFRGKKSKEEKPGDFGYWYQVLDVVS